MALGQTLRYYRGQFNPEAAYQSGENSAGIISMYNPQAEAQFIDAVAQRQGRFDASIAAVSAEKARIGETETYDLAELNNRLKSFESGINELVKSKYNGDYSAAANEIAKKIGTERTNPFYHFNKEKVQMGKAYLDAKMKYGPNFLSAGNPFDVTFQDWQNGKTFEFTPINSADVTQRSAALFQNFAKQVRSDSGLQLSPEGQYFKNTIQQGFRNEQEAMDFAQKSGLLDQIYDSMPELRGVENQEAVLAAIRQGAMAGIGTTETRYLQNQAFMNASELANLSEKMGGQNLLQPVGMKELPISKKEILANPQLWGNDIEALSQEVAKKPYKELNGRERRAVKERMDKAFATPMYGLMRYNVYEGSTNTKMDALAKNLNTIANTDLARGDLIGVDEENSRLLKDISDLKIKSFSVVTTRNPETPYVLNLQLTGTPGGGKGNRTPAPIEIDTYVAPGSIDSYNLFGYFSGLDNSIYSGVINKLKAIGNEMGAAKLREAYEGIPSNIK